MLWFSCPPFSAKIKDWRCTNFRETCASRSTSTSTRVHIFTLSGVILQLWKIAPKIIFIIIFQQRVYRRESSMYSSKSVFVMRWVLLGIFKKREGEQPSIIGAMSSFSNNFCSTRMSISVRRPLEASLSRLIELSYIVFYFFTFSLDITQSLEYPMRFRWSRVVRTLSSNLNCLICFISLTKSISFSSLFTAF